MKGFCLNLESFASIGGKQRRNILNHQELCICHGLVLFSILFENIMFLIFYFKQDVIGTSNVFLANFLYSVLSDMFLIVILPATVLYKSVEEYPEMWTSFVPKPLKSYSSKINLTPRRSQSDYDMQGDEYSSVSN